MDVRKGKTFKAASKSRLRVSGPMRLGCGLAVGPLQPGGRPGGQAARQQVSQAAPTASSPTEFCFLSMGRSSRSFPDDGMRTSQWENWRHTAHGQPASLTRRRHQAGFFLSFFLPSFFLPGPAPAPDPAPASSASPVMFIYIYIYIYIYACIYIYIYIQIYIYIYSHPF